MLFDKCTLDDVLQHEADQEGVRTKNIGEVVNYVNAMNYGLALTDLTNQAQVLGILVESCRSQKEVAKRFRVESVAGLGFNSNSISISESIYPLAPLAGRGVVE